MNSSFRIFLSWQSDLPEEATTALIRKALRTAQNNAERSNAGLKIYLDEATRDMPGSPNIPDAIMNKIRTTDMFVCDVTTTGKSADGKATPNPNVAFELGFAVATLGWSRVVLLFNKTLGTFPADMPFDFDRQRAMGFVTDNPPNKGNEGQLAANLTNAIQSVLVGPHPPLDAFDEKTTKRNRDIRNLQRVLSTLHFPSLDEHILVCTEQTKPKIIHFWTDFDEVMRSSLFHLYDADLLSTLKRLHRGLGDTVAHGEYFHLHPNGQTYVFEGKGRAAQEAQSKIKAGVYDLRGGMVALLQKIRQDYVEIDVEDTNRAAWEDFKRSDSEASSLLGNDDSEDEETVAKA